MSYELVITRRAAKDIARLGSEARKRVREGLEKCREEPLKHARKMMDASLGTYRLRIGDYRVIFDLDGDQLVVLRAGHRKDVYRG